MSFKRRLARMVGDRLGLEIIPKAGAAGWPEERFMAELLTRARVDCVFDVGANAGQYGRSLRRLGYRGTILSFEPGPEAFGRLEAASGGDGAWHAFNCALGGAEGTLPFNIMKATEMSSFLRPSVKPGEPFSDVNVVARTIDVPVRTLAAVHAEARGRFGFARPFLKLDTQGYDLHVVRGAGASLADMVGVLSEVSARPLYEDSPLIGDSLRLFGELGFDLARLFPVHAGDLASPHEFNCYVLRRGLAL